MGTLSDQDLWEGKNGRNELEVEGAEMGRTAGREKTYSLEEQRWEKEENGQSGY